MVHDGYRYKKRNNNNAPSRGSIPSNKENPPPSWTTTVTRCSGIGQGSPLAATSRWAALHDLVAAANLLQQLRSRN